MSSLLHYTLVEQINFINICLIIINRQELISANFNKRLLAGSTSVKNHWNFSGVFLQCSIQYVHWIDSATCGKLRYLLECDKLLLIFWYLSIPQVWQGFNLREEEPPPPLFPSCCIYSMVHPVDRKSWEASGLQCNTLLYRIMYIKGSWTRKKRRFFSLNTVHFVKNFRIAVRFLILSSHHIQLEFYAQINQCLHLQYFNK